MEIKKIKHGSKGTLVIDEGSERLAELTHSKAKEKRIIIDHTNVLDKLRGKSVGKELVIKAVKFVRASHIKTFPYVRFHDRSLIKHRRMQMCGTCNPVFETPPLSQAKICKRAAD